MKKALVLVVLSLASFFAASKEMITVLNPQGPTHSGTPQLMAVIDEANKSQNKYQFQIEFKVGAFESIALRELNDFPQTKLSTMTNASYEAISRGLITESDLVPVFSQGDSCWAVIGVTGTNNGLDSIKSVTEIVAGGPAIGGALHLAALEIGRRYNIPVRKIVFKSSYDALVNMAANNGVNFTLERVKNYESFKDKNKDMHMLAMSCPVRHPQAPALKTLIEYGIDTPFVWQQLVASKNMNPSKVQEFNDIFSSATLAIGAKRIQELSDQTPPIFNNVSSATHYRQSLDKLKSYREKFKKEIEAAR
jgi:tripartite-type tricarboxylate transporter receptor subunit TctC